MADDTEKAADRGQPASQRRMRRALVAAGLLGVAAAALLAWSAGW